MTTVTANNDDALAGMKPVRSDMDKGGWFRGNDLKFQFVHGSVPAGLTAEDREVSGRFYTAPVGDGVNDDETIAAAHDELMDVLRDDDSYRNGFIIGFDGDLSIDVTNRVGNTVCITLAEDMLALQRKLAERDISMYGTLYIEPLVRVSNGRCIDTDLMDRCRWELDTDGRSRLIGVGLDDDDRYADGVGFDEV